MSDNLLQMTMLFDFFGDLLTEKQREYFDLYHNEDLSLSEIAAQAGISRQGVHDMLSRAEHSLRQMESKTGIVSKWAETRAELEHARNLTTKLLQLTKDNPQASDITGQLADTLTRLAEK
ncbi:MAG: YlxM family DNA-binding protein [Oscillospiraceae bacterium]|nr:YlxM family DNA-binding protein [Oscillospiraceae bacterium]